MEYGVSGLAELGAAGEDGGGHFGSPEDELGEGAGRGGGRGGGGRLGGGVWAASGRHAVALLDADEGLETEFVEEGLDLLGKVRNGRFATTTLFFISIRSAEAWAAEVRASARVARGTGGGRVLDFEVEEEARAA